MYEKFSVQFVEEASEILLENVIYRNEMSCKEDFDCVVDQFFEGDLRLFQNKLMGLLQY